MKIKIYFATLSISLFLLCTGLVPSLAQAFSNGNVDFQITSSKDSYTLGEPIDLNFTFKNNGTDKTVVPIAGVKTGSIHVFISKDGNDYRRYSTAGWGTLDLAGGGLTELKPTEAYKTSASVLWNGKPSYDHMSKSSAKIFDEMDRRVLTYLPFSEPGDYFLKAVSFVAQDLEGIETLEIESQPVLISIVEPKFEELETWNVIKNEPELGFFIQHGRFSDRVRSKEKRENLMKEVTKRIGNRPDGFYAKHFKKAYEKFIKKEEKKQRFLEKVRKQRQGRN